MTRWRPENLLISRSQNWCLQIYLQSRVTFTFGLHTLKVDRFMPLPRGPNKWTDWWTDRWRTPASLVWQDIKHEWYLLVIRDNITAFYKSCTVMLLGITSKYHFLRLCHAILAGGSIIFSTCPSMCYQTCQYNILKTNEPILMQRHEMINFGGQDVKGRSRSHKTKDRFVDLAQASFSNTWDLVAFLDSSTRGCWR